MLGLAGNSIGSSVHTAGSLLCGVPEVAVVACTVGAGLAPCRRLRWVLCWRSP